MPSKYSVYEGVFVCQKCNSEVDKLRLWRDTLDLTWQCQSCKFVSKVKLDVRGY